MPTPDPAAIWIIFVSFCRAKAAAQLDGQPYTGINILSLWASASVQGFAAPIWMTYRQAVELDAHVRKGEKGSPVVYANSITRNETDTDPSHTTRTTIELRRDLAFAWEREQAMTAKTNALSLERVAI